MIYRVIFIAAIGEFVPELIKERSMEGRLKAIARGVKFGANRS